MYDQQPDSATLMFIYVFIEIVIPIFVLIVFIVLAVKAISFLAQAFSPDGGLSRREQLHRHRLENFAAFMTFAAFIIGGVMLLHGDPSGEFKVTFPGGVVMENVGVPVIFLGFASSILWTLLKVKGRTGPNGSDKEFAKSRLLAKVRSGRGKPPQPNPCVPGAHVQPKPAFPAASGSGVTQPNSASFRTSHITSPPSSLSEELERLMEIDRELINGKDTITASAKLREWKKRVAKLTKSDEVYRIEADDDRKGKGMYGVLRNTMRKCRRYVEDVLSASSI